MRRGEEWAVPAAGPADIEVRGDDAALADTVRDHPGALISFRPEHSDVARAVGLGTSASGEREVTLDALRVAGRLAVNMVIVGTPPHRVGRLTRQLPVEVRVDGRVAFADRATTIVVANGQFLRGRDLVPSGHPGDGRLEVQVYALAPAGRRPMRRRLAVGTHLPHPGIVVTHGRVVELALGRPAAVEADGIRLFSAADVVVEAVPGAYRLLL